MKKIVISALVLVMLAVFATAEEVGDNVNFQVTLNCPGMPADLDMTDGSVRYLYYAWQLLDADGFPTGMVAEQNMLFTTENPLLISVDHVVDSAGMWELTAGMAYGRFRFVGVWKEIIL